MAPTDFVDYSFLAHLAQAENVNVRYTVHTEEGVKRTGFRLAKRNLRAIREASGPRTP